MTYSVGLLAVILFTFITHKIGQFTGLSARIEILSFYKLHYLASGFVLAWFFPSSFMVIFENNMGIVLLFCLAWIGLFYGCNIEIRTHQKYPLKTFLFHLAEPLIVFIFTALGGILYIYTKYNDIRYIDVVLITAIFSSITLFKRHNIPYREGEVAFHSVINDLLAARNIFAIILLCIAGSLLYSTGEFVLFGHIFTGVFAFFIFHVIAGSGLGIVLSMLMRGAPTTDSMLIALIGMTALTGGIAFIFSLSPLFLGMVSGMFLINSTLKRLQIIESLSISHEFIEKIFMFFLGALLMQLFTLNTVSPGIIFAGAAGIVIIRSLLKYFLASIWVTRFNGYNKGTSLLWAGLTGQGIIAAGAAVEYRLRLPNMPSVFLLLIFLLILNQTVTGIYVLKNR